MDWAAAFLEHQLSNPILREVDAPRTVDLRVVPVAGTEVFEEEAEAKEVQSFRRRWGALLRSPGRRTLLVGVPGAGKTVSLAQLALHLTHRAFEPKALGDQPPLPIWMEAREVPAEVVRTTDVLLGRLDAGGVYDPPPLGPLLQAGQIVLLIDGLQEVGEVGGRLDVLAKLLDLPGLVKVATTRPGFEIAGLRGPGEVLLLRGLEPLDREALADSYGLDAQARERAFRLAGRERLRRAVEVPQVWTMVLDLAHRGELDPEAIDSTSALYEAFLRSSLEAGLARLRRQREGEPDPADVRAVLELLAAAAVFSRETQVEHERAVELCRKWMEVRRQTGMGQPFSDRSAHQIVLDLPRFFPPIRHRDRVGGRAIGFSHGSLAEALAAAFLHGVCPVELEPAALWTEPLLAPTLGFWGEFVEKTAGRELRELDALRIEQGSAELLRGWLRDAPRHRIEAHAVRLVRRLGQEAEDRWRAQGLVRALQHQGVAWARQTLLPQIGVLEKRRLWLVDSLFDRGSASSIARWREEEAEQQRRRAIDKMRRKHRLAGPREDGDLPTLLGRLPQTADAADQIRLLEAIMVRGEEGSAATVIPLLRSEDARVVQTAAKTLRVLGDRAAVKPLLSVLGHPSEGVRSAAAKALGLLQDEAAIPDLQRLLVKDRDRSPGTAAALALALLGAHGVSATLREMLDSANPITRATAAKALGWLGEESVTSRLIDMLNPDLEQDGITRGSAATALGQIGDPIAVDGLVQSLGPNYENHSIARGSAARALGHIGDARAVDALLLSLDPAYEVDEPTRSNAARALGDIGDPRAVDALVRSLKPAYEKHSYTRRSVATALGQIGDRQAVDALLASLDSAYEDDGTVRGAAATALGRIGDPRAADVLLRALDPDCEDDGITRARAATALGQIGDSRVVEALLRSLDPASEVNGDARASAATALGLIGDFRAVEALVRSVDPTYEVRGDARGSAATALGLIGDSRAVDALLRCLEPDYEDDGMTRGGAATALGRIGDSRAVDVLVGSLDPAQEPHGGARGSVAMALGQIGDPRAVDALVRSLDPAHEDAGIVRGSAATALGQIGDSRAVDALVRSLDPVHEDNGIVRGSAATALGQIGDPEAEEPIRRALTTEVQPIVVWSLLGARRRLAAATGHLEESARQLERDWSTLFERFLHLTAHPADRVFAASLRLTLENLARRFGDQRAEGAEEAPVAERHCQRFLAGLLGQLQGLSVVEEGVPGVRGRFDILVLDAARRGHLLELKVIRPGSSRSLVEDVSQLDRYLADIAAHHHIHRPEGHLIYFDTCLQPRGAADVEREEDVDGHAVWRVHVNRRQASDRKT